MFALFPVSSLDNSILTSVLVGLLVVWAFQETLGWNFTGLVVPGYLASIFIIQPIAGAVVVVEAVICWGVVLVVSERVPAWWPWTALFGRDRFFLFLLVSVAIRLMLEAGGFALMADHFGVLVDADLHSMGLVVVPLAANALWRSGSTNALLRLGVPVGITWALLTGVVLPLTNLSLSSFELTYEDLALDFVSSPHAYVLLLVGAWLGSLVNHRWGWDFGGIIVPGLLALCWLHPARLVATLGEAMVIALLLRSVVRLPWFRTANLTGGRPLVLAFVLGYALKFTLASTLGGAWPGFAVRDLFGFGYLLSSIVALRIVKHGDVFRSVVPALVTSLAAFVVGSSAGYLLVVAFPGAPPPPLPHPPGLVVLRERVLDAAWTASGAPPDGIAAAVARRAETVVTGGDGFGALWIREAGRDVAVVGHVGPQGIGPATMAVAEALDARVVLVCAAAESRACLDATDAIALHLPILRVGEGARTRLVLTGRAASAIDLGALGTLLGPFSADNGGRTPGRAHLELDAGARLRAAVAAIGEAPAPGTYTSPVPPPEDPHAAPPDAARLRHFLSDVALPVLAWRSGADDAHLALAVGSAHALGLAVAREGDVATIAGPEWMARLDRAGDATVIYVPDARGDAEGLDAARALRVALRAGVAVTDAPTAGAAAAGRSQRYADALLLAAIDAAGAAANVVTVRSVPRTLDPGADVVLSVGVPSRAAAELPDAARDLHALLAAAEFSVGLQDGSAQRMSLTDGLAAERAAGALSAGGPAQVTFFAAPGAARRLTAPTEADPRVASITAARLGRRAWDVDRMAEWAVGEPDATWTETLAALDAFVQHRPDTTIAPVRRALARSGGSVSLVCDPALGCRWLAAEHCDATTCDGVLVPLERGAALARRARPEATRPALRPVEALALAAADLAYRRPAAAP